MSPLEPTDLGLLTVREAAALARVEPATIRTWIHRYQLPTTTVLGEVMVTEKALLDCERDRRRARRGRPRKTTD